MFPPNKWNIQNEKKSIKNRIFDEEDNIYKNIKILTKSIEQMKQMISIFWIEILSKIRTSVIVITLKYLKLILLYSQSAKCITLKTKQKLLKKLLTSLNINIMSCHSHP